MVFHTSSLGSPGAVVILCLLLSSICVICVAASDADRYGFGGTGVVNDVTDKMHEEGRMTLTAGAERCAALFPSVVKLNTTREVLLWTQVASMQWFTGVVVNGTPPDLFDAQQYPSSSGVVGKGKGEVSVNVGLGRIHTGIDGKIQGPHEAAHERIQGLLSLCNVTLQHPQVTAACDWTSNKTTRPLSAYAGIWGGIPVNSQGGHAGDGQQQPGGLFGLAGGQQQQQQQQQEGGVGGITPAPCIVGFDVSDTAVADDTSVTLTYHYNASKTNSSSNSSTPSRTPGLVVDLRCGPDAEFGGGISFSGIVYRSANPISGAPTYTITGTSSHICTPTPVPTTPAPMTHAPLSPPKPPNHPNDKASELVPLVLLFVFLTCATVLLTRRIILLTRLVNSVPSGAEAEYSVLP